ncbi:MAG: hypothetical protein NTW29_08585 [Bacteroidetes bacterium]|nr:hypothetical protein [Bacteroidota bacterium]
MPEIPANSDGQFLVKEEKSINYVLAILLFAMGAYGLFGLIRDGLKDIDYQNVFLPFAFIPAVYCMRRANSPRVYIRINATGIYQDEKLVTDWPRFLKAYITQKEKKPMLDLRDNFLLVVEFRSADKEKTGIRRRIPLTNTQNKSEEQIMEAVERFLATYKETKA